MKTIIIIVGDELGKSLSLADQFEELSMKYPELKIEVGGICYFHANTEAAQKIIEIYDTKNRHIEIVSLWNFYEVMEWYEEKSFAALPHGGEICKHIFIMDFMLEGDGSDGIPERSATIRYAKNMNRLDSDNIWFYTAGDTRAESALYHLVPGHVLTVVEKDGDYLRLQLESNDAFMNRLRAGQK